jgi:F-type H+-transporting ATPase subunit epsilon
VPDERPLSVEIVTPDGPVVAGEIEMVVVPGVDGELGILRRHEALVTLLAIGETRIKWPDGRVQRVASGIGYAQVLFDRVLVVVDHAETADAIDVERARHAEERARERLRLRGDPAAQAEIDYYRAEQALKRAANRLRVAGHLSAH